MQRNAFLASAAGVFLSGCARRSSPASLTDIETGGQPFRAAFNRDYGTVRIVCLVSPT
jgi:hypothetical protein